MKTQVVALCASLLLLACSGPVKRTSNAIVVTAGEDTKTYVRLEPVTENIIRVSAYPSKNGFSTRQSLMRAPQAPPVPTYEIATDDNRVTLATAALSVTVDLSSGAVSFANAQGSLLLAEPQGGGKSFTPIEVESDRGYTVRQVFESPRDEAFYGLGQHQSDEFNYKGKDEELFQYNTKVSIPFIVSTKNYGLLWDNNSLSRFGDPRPYSNIDVLDLEDSEGVAGALTATYASRDGQKIYLARREHILEYDNLETVSRFPKDIPFYNTKITWSGTMTAKESGIHRFSLYYAGYTKVFVNEEEVVSERWRTAWNPNTYKFQVEMEAGEKVPLRIEWIPDGGVSYIALKLHTPVDPQQQMRQSWWSEMGDMIDYYFVYGETADSVISGYRTLTGKSQIMPKWAMGFWQSRERYKTQHELIDAFDQYRQRHIPIDNIVQDWSYWPEDAWGSHDFEASRFPDPKAMVDSIHALNGRVMISVWPKFYHNTDHFKEFDSKGWMYRKAVDDSVRDWIAQGYVGSFYDAYSAPARQLFWEQMNEHLFSLGMDAWWMDASEPDIVSNSSLEARKQLSTPTALGPSTRYLNAYALVNAMAIYDGQRATAPNQRVFLLTRSGFPGLQRYSTATWSGDIGTCWEDMKAQISAGLNFALSGIPYWTMDIGGFCVQRRFERAPEGSADREEWRELQMRWHQFGAFCPLFRSHGQYPYREIYNTAPEGHPAYESMVWYNTLRYRLMPYIYTMAGRTWFDDYTIMRALVMDFAADANVWDISDQYMFGDAFMACPVYEYKARSRNVYLPQGSDWYDFNTGAFLQGGQWILADAPYERMPLYVKAGSVIPVGPRIESTAQQTDLPVTLYVYAGADGKGDLYEDEGVNYNYEQGKYSRIRFTYHDANETLTVSAREGAYDGMEPQRTFQVVLMRPEKLRPFEENMPIDATFTYNGAQVTLKLGAN